MEFGGLDNFLMTTSNVYLEDDLETLQINHTSIAGIGIIQGLSDVDRHEYY